MSVLKRIDEDLQAAKEHVRDAGNRAKKAGDNDGADRCDKMGESIEELKKNFSKKGK